jgi:Fe-S cluster biogenesis protein NfuA
MFHFEGTEIEVKIQQILHDYVRPAVEQDGGAISTAHLTKVW